MKEAHLVKLRSSLQSVPGNQHNIRIARIVAIARNNQRLNRQCIRQYHLVFADSGNDSWNRERLNTMPLIGSVDDKKCRLMAL